MSLIKKSHELSEQSFLKILLYGQAGIGKTTLALSGPSPLLIDFDNGVNRVNYNHLEDVATVQVKTYQDFIDVLEKEDLDEFKTLIIDTGGKCLDFMSDWIIKRNPKLGRNGSLTLQGYGERKSLFNQLVFKISNLNKHLIFVAHRETKTENETQRYVPLFGGSSYDSLVTELDLVGYIEADGNDRLITFNPTSKNDGKNTLNLANYKLPILLDSENNIIANNDFIKNVVLKKNAEKMAFRKAQNKAYSDLITIMTNNIENITDIATSNEFVVNMASIIHIGSSKIKIGALLKAKTESLNLIWNKDKKSYDKV